MLENRSNPGADPEILHGRWLMRWLPISYNGARGWLVNNDGRLLYYEELVKGGG